MVESHDSRRLIAALNTLYQRHGSQFVAIDHPNCSKHKIGRTPQGNLAILINCGENAGNYHSRLNFRLQRLHCWGPVPCDVIVPKGASARGVFVIIELLEHNADLESWYLLLAEALVAKVGMAPLPSEVEAEFQGLVSLFKALQTASKRDIQGLWAELAVISQSVDPRTMAMSWHVDPTATHDFALGPARIECKSYSGNERIHHCSRAQLRPNDGSEVLLVSVKIIEAASGASVRDLFQAVAALLNACPSELRHVSEVLVTALGTNWTKADSFRFDVAAASQSTRCYRAQDVPSVEEPISPHISDVRFRVNLEGLPTWTPTGTDNPLWAAAMTRGHDDAHTEQ